VQKYPDHFILGKQLQKEQMASLSRQSLLFLIPKGPFINYFTLFEQFLIPDPVGARLTKLHNANL